MAKKFFAFSVVVLLVLASAIAEAQCKPTLKQRSIGAVILGSFGTAIGAAADRNNRARGAMIGGAIGGSIGAFGARNTACMQKLQAEQNRNPYNDRVADALDPKPAPLAASTILIDSIRGADREKIEQVLIHAAAHRHYSVITKRELEDRKHSMRSAAGFRPQDFQLVDWKLVATVEQMAYTNGNGGGNAGHGNVFGSGNGSVSGGDFQVALTLIDASTGKPDPERSAIMEVRVVTHRSGNGFLTIAGISGYGSHTYSATDPRTTAMEEAIGHFFGLTD